MENINKVRNGLEFLQFALTNNPVIGSLEQINDRIDDPIFDIEHDHYNKELAEKLENTIGLLNADFEQILSTIRQANHLLSDLRKQVERNTTLYNLLVLSYKAFDEGCPEEAKTYSKEFVESCDNKTANLILEEFCNEFKFDGNTTSTDWLNFHKENLK